MLTLSLGDGWNSPKKAVSYMDIVTGNDRSRDSAHLTLCIMKSICESLCEKFTKQQVTYQENQDDILSNHLQNI